MQDSIGAALLQVQVVFLHSNIVNIQVLEHKSILNFIRKLDRDKGQIKYSGQH